MCDERHHPGRDGGGAFFGEGRALVVGVQAQASYLPAATSVKDPLHAEAATWLRILSGGTSHDSPMKSHRHVLRGLA